MFRRGVVAVAVVGLVAGVQVTVPAVSRAAVVGVVSKPPRVPDVRSVAGDGAPQRVAVDGLSSPRKDDLPPQADTAPPHQPDLIEQDAVKAKGRVRKAKKWVAAAADLTLLPGRRVGPPAGVLPVEVTLEDTPGSRAAGLVRGPTPA